MRKYQHATILRMDDYLIRLRNELQKNLDALRSGRFRIFMMDTAGGDRGEDCTSIQIQMLERQLNDLNTLLESRNFSL
jgi:hypothetical protein